jgi:hypothetical protein
LGSPHELAVHNQEHHLQSGESVNQQFHSVRGESDFVLEARKHTEADFRRHGEKKGKNGPNVMISSNSNEFDDDFQAHQSNLQKRDTPELDSQLEFGLSHHIGDDYDSFSQNNGRNLDDVIATAPEVDYPYWKGDNPEEGNQELSNHRDQSAFQHLDEDGDALADDDHDGLNKQYLETHQDSHGTEEGTEEIVHAHHDDDDNKYSDEQATRQSQVLHVENHESEVEDSLELHHHDDDHSNFDEEEHESDLDAHYDSLNIPSMDEHIESNHQEVDGSPVEAEEDGEDHKSDSQISTEDDETSAPLDTSQGAVTDRQIVNTNQDYPNPSSDENLQSNHVQREDVEMNNGKKDPIQFSAANRFHVRYMRQSHGKEHKAEPSPTKSHRSESTPTAESNVSQWLRHYWNQIPPIVR